MTRLDDYLAEQEKIPERAEALRIARQKLRDDPIVGFMSYFDEKTGLIVDRAIRRSEVQKT